MEHHYCSLSFWQGVRRISALLVCMLFTFVFVVSPIKVRAEAFPIPPVWLPMNPYNAQGLEGNYVLLNDDQKEIVKEIIGAVNVVNLGFGQYVFINPISGVQNTRQFLREYGGTFLETFWTQIMGTSRAMTDFVGSTIYKASTYDTLAEYEADTAPSVASGSQKYFQISPELTVAFKNWYRANGGVEDWQIQAKEFESAFVWDNVQLTSNELNYWNNYYNSMVHPVKCNYPSVTSETTYKWLNAVVDIDLSSYYLFMNTTTHYVYLVDSNGEQVSSLTPIAYLNCPYAYGNIRYVSQSRNGAFFNFSSFNYYSLDDITAVNVFKYINEHITVISPIRYYSSSTMECSLDLFSSIGGCYAGANWSSRERIYNIDDLNIGSTPSEYIDNISDIGYVDINTLIGQIADELVNLRDVVEESVLVKDNDSAIPYADSLQIAIDKYINQPESGVVIPSDIFGGLTGANGPVSYLWFMTKPLVSYTGDLLGLLTLEGDGTFQFTGLGYIVIGVVTIGIIGGLVTKCLL